MPILYTVRGRHYFQSFDIFDQHLELHVKHSVYVAAFYAKLVTLSDHMENSAREDIQLLQDCRFIGNCRLRSLLPGTVPEVLSEHKRKY